MTKIRPGDLLLVRHAESTGNVAREIAESSGADVVGVDRRDPDVPLTELGETQAAALGQRLAELELQAPIGRVWVSPYERARATAAIAVEHAGLTAEMRVDERLRDRELGVLDRLTSHGVRARYPDEADRRRYLGKLYYRPPCGESWADVVLRLRAFLADRDRLRERERAAGAELVVTHDAVILLFRYILQRLSEGDLLTLARGESVGNASITWLRPVPGDGAWELREFATDDHLHRPGTAPTRPAADHGSAEPATSEQR